MFKNSLPAWGGCIASISHILDTLVDHAIANARQINSRCCFQPFYYNLTGVVDKSRIYSWSAPQGPNCLSETWTELGAVLCRTLGQRKPPHLIPCKWHFTNTVSFTSYAAFESSLDSIWNGLTRYQNEGMLMALLYCRGAEMAITADSVMTSPPWKPEKCSEGRQ